MIKKDTQQVKVIELVGQKLDPNAKYLFVVHESAMPIDRLDNVFTYLEEQIGRNFVVAVTSLPINETLKVYEVMPNE